MRARGRKDPEYPKFSGRHLWMVSNRVIFAHHLHVTLATPLLELGLALLKRPLAVKSVSHLERKRWRILSCILKALNEFNLRMTKSMWSIPYRSSTLFQYLPVNGNGGWGRRVKDNGLEVKATVCCGGIACLH